MERRLAAILAADIVGYSKMMGVDEVSTLRAIKVHRAELIDSAIAEHRGQIIKLMGDGMLVEFPSVVEATSCALKIQEGMVSRNAGSAADKQIHLRIGINVGDIIVEDDDIFGDGVNVAARLEGIATPGGVCLSDFAHDQVVNRIETRFEDGGDRILKNIARPIRVWHWSTNQPGEAGPSASHINQAPPSKPSIAVLPFANLSSDPEQSYFADGVTDDIIAALSRARWLFVIARNTSFSFKDQTIPTDEFCRQLGVQYVLEGGVRKAGDRVRVTASLQEPERGRQVWAERYDGTLEDLFDFQDQVTHQIVSALQPNLLDAEEERSRRSRPTNLSGWDYVVRARPHLWSWNAEDCNVAKVLLLKALEADPNYGLAHSMLAYVHVVSGWQGWHDNLDLCISESVSESERAIALDPADSWAHVALGMSYGLQRKNTEALVELERALELDPNSTLAFAMLGMVRSWGGDGDGALTAFDAAVRCNPRDPFNRVMGAMYATAHFVAGRYEECANAALETGRKIPGLVGAWRAAAAAQALLGDTEQARASFAKVRQLQPNISADWMRAHMPFTSGDHLDRWVEGLQRAGMP